MNPMSRRKSHCRPAARRALAAALLWAAALTPCFGQGDPAAGLVRLQGTSVADDRGPFLGLGATYMRALNKCKFDRPRFESDCAFLASKGVRYIRVLGMLAWCKGDAIAPVAFKDFCDVPTAAWPDYDRQLTDCIDTAYDRYGLRTELTIFADAQNVMPNKADRVAHLDRILRAIAGREHKLMHLEVCNEAFKNGFPEPGGGIADLREFGEFLARRTRVLVALSTPYGESVQDIAALYRDSAATLTTIHFSRDLRVDRGWGPIRDCWRAVGIPGIPPVSSNEPIGPGSSVASESSSIKIAMGAAYAWTANVPCYVFHCRAGISGVDKATGREVRFEQMPGLNELGNVLKILPADVSSWTRHDGVEASAPVALLSGAVQSIGAVKGNDFVCLPIGIEAGGVRLKARRPLAFKVFNPVAGAAPVDAKALKEGEEVTLPQGPGAYILKGAFGAGTAPSVRIASPADGASFAPGSDVAITAEASDPDGRVAKVEFFQGGALVGTASAAPFAVTWTGVPAGIHELTARATDDSGESATSAPVNLVEASLYRAADRPPDTANGLDYALYKGEWKALPDFGALTAAQTGTASGFDIGAAAAGGGKRVLDDPLRGATLGTRGNVARKGPGGSFVADGWRVDKKDDYIVWRLPAPLPRGAAEFRVKGLDPKMSDVNADKSEIFHMYDWTDHNSDAQYSPGYRDNPFKHFLRKINSLDAAAGKTGRMEIVWQILPAGADNGVENDTAVLAWDPAVNYRFREEWGPDGKGGSFFNTHRDGERIMAVTLKGEYKPGGHSVRIGASTRSPLYKDFGAQPGAVYGDVKVWDLAGVDAVSDHFAVRFTGFVRVPADGVYTFYAGSDDGSRLWIGSTLVVDNDGVHKMWERSGAIALRAGKHAVTVAMFQATGAEGLVVGYSGPGIAKTEIPAEALFRSRP